MAFPVISERPQHRSETVPRDEVELHRAHLGQFRDEDWHSRLQRASSIRRQLSRRKESEIDHANAREVFLAKTLNAAAAEFCMPDSPRDDEAFFDAALELAITGSTLSLRIPQMENIPRAEDSNDWTLDQLISVLAGRSRQQILQQQEEIFCLRLVVRELMRGILSTGNREYQFENKETATLADESNRVSSPSESVRKSGTPRAATTPSTVTSTVASSNDGTPQSADSYGPPYSSRSPNRRHLAERQRINKSVLDDSHADDDYSDLRDIQLQLNGKMREMEKEEDASPSLPSTLMKWKRRHEVPNDHRDIEENQVSSSAMPENRNGPVHQTPSGAVTPRLRQASNDDEDTQRFTVKTTEQAEKDTGVRSGGNQVTVGRAGNVADNTEDTNMERTKYVTTPPRTSNGLSGDGVRMPPKPKRIARVDQCDVPTNILNESDQKNPYVFEDESEDEDSEDKENEPQRRLLALFTSTPIRGSQKANQQSALAILKTNKIEADVIDGSDPEYADAKKSLFVLSGSNDYPQFFLVEDDGMTEFFCDFPELKRLNEVGELSSKFLQLNSKSVLEDEDAATNGHDGNFTEIRGDRVSPKTSRLSVDQGSSDGRNEKEGGGGGEETSDPETDVTGTSLERYENDDGEDLRWI